MKGGTLIREILFASNLVAGIKGESILKCLMKKIERVLLHIIYMVVVTDDRVCRCLSLSTF